MAKALLEGEWTPVGGTTDFTHLSNRRMYLFLVVALVISLVVAIIVLVFANKSENDTNNNNPPDPKTYD
jgi:flagellar basal body-associated protein FliL